MPEQRDSISLPSDEVQHVQHIDQQGDAARTDMDRDAGGECQLHRVLQNWARGTREDSY